MTAVMDVSVLLNWLAFVQHWYVLNEMSELHDCRLAYHDCSLTTRNLVSCFTSSETVVESWALVVEARSSLPSALWRKRAGRVCMCVYWGRGHVWEKHVHATTHKI